MNKPNTLPESRVLFYRENDPVEREPDPFPDPESEPFGFDPSMIYGY